MMKENDFHLLPVWYPELAVHTFITTFVPLRKEAVELLAVGELNDLDEEKRISDQVIEDLRNPMEAIPGSCFVGVDSCAPTDTERFAQKRGAVCSPASAWKFLRRSAKVRAAAKAGEVSCIWVRPYRHMTDAREFRLFIRDGKLFAASQYHCARPFRRLEGVKDQLYLRLSTFVGSIAWRLPKVPMVMDVYFTSGYARIMIVDLNRWGKPTDPLLIQNWGRDWSAPIGMLLLN